MTKYAQHVSTKTTPQSEAIPDKDMVQNSAGGFGFAIDDWQRLDRWLILGADGGTYYASERKLTQENAQCVLRCLKEDAARTVQTIVDISKAGRAPKNDPAIFALALAFAHGAPEAKKLASAALPEVCRIGTHIFQFATAINELRGWGRSVRKAVANWYLSKDARSLSHQLTKYQQRDGWSHRDLLRLCHAKANDETINSALRWAVGKNEFMHPEALEDASPLVSIQAFEAAKRAKDKAEIVKLIRDYKLVRECVPTQFLTEPEVWEALLEDMPLTAMIRNLATMTRIGLLGPLAKANAKVIGELGNSERLRKSRVHPIAVLSALLTYKQGHGERGKNTWTPVQQIVDALDGAFYTSFDNVEPTGKRWYLGIDVSGSMWSGTIAGVPGLTPGIAAACMAMVTAKVESNHYFAAFSAKMVPFDVSPRERLDTVVQKLMQKLMQLPWGGTDCAQPMLDALTRKIEVDAFVTYSDNESWAGTVHPCQALERYRREMKIPAKFVACGMTATEYSVADKDDAGSTNVVGFDTATPQLIANFVA